MTDVHAKSLGFRITTCILIVFLRICLFQKCCARIWAWFIAQDNVWTPFGITEQHCTAFEGVIGLGQYLAFIARLSVCAHMAVASNRVSRGI
jgi:hypothetical protein